MATTSKSDDKDQKATAAKVADKKDDKAPEVPAEYERPVDADGDGIADDALKGTSDEPRKDADGTVANPPDTAPSPTPYIPGGVPGNNGPI